MIILKESKMVQTHIRELKNEGAIVSLVPTMGALHPAHLSLVKAGRKNSDVVGMSIFVNPSQFNDPNDYLKYPNTLENDIKLAEESGVDILFTPSHNEIFGENISIKQSGDFYGKTHLKAPSLSNALCGKSRPGHFDGVVTIVNILFNIFTPDIAIFGEKDFQQLQVIKKMVQDLKMGIEIIGAPTVREIDNLAMSSRNSRLSAEGRYHALYINQSLFKAREIALSGEASAEKILNITTENLVKSGGLEIDYVQIFNENTLVDTDTIDKDSRIAVAVFCEGVRLIDNIKLLD